MVKVKESRALRKLKKKFNGSGSFIDFEAEWDELLRKVTEEELREIAFTWHYLNLGNVHTEFKIRSRAINLIDDIRLLEEFVSSKTLNSWQISETIVNQDKEEHKEEHKRTVPLCSSLCSIT